MASSNLGLVGIERRGVPLAQRLAKILSRIEKLEVPVGTLDITLLSRRPLHRRPSPRGASAATWSSTFRTRTSSWSTTSSTPGRTTRAALDALFDHGRPRRIQLAVLIDRGHRELPIEAGFVGRKVQTTDNEIIEVKLRKPTASEKVLLVERLPEGQ